MNLKELIQEYYAECKVAQLATVREGMPWICTVYFTVDQEGPKHLLDVCQKEAAFSRYFRRS
jgi:nitroimidazol reductase NimA-like FMN-containing flavoprotein (pyridoxamine 5'-phosphate oxidase superfamily)